MDISKLTTIPLEVKEALFFIDKIDHCFSCGFSYIQDEEYNTLQSLTTLFSESKLHEALPKAIESLKDHTYSLETFKVLAIARSSLMGSVYDTLFDTATEQLSYNAQKYEALSSDNIDSPLLESVSHWLKEIALNGFSQIEDEQLTPFMQTIESLFDKGLYSEGTLLKGFLDELLSFSDEHIPLRRWVDLWSRAMIISIKQIPHPQGQLVSGELSPLGVSINQHNNAVQLNIKALLKNDQSHFVTITLTAFKVDSITGHFTWRLFDTYPLLLDALASLKTVTINNMILLPSGNLIWNEESVQKGKKHNPFKTWEESISSAAHYKIPPHSRHYIHINIPIVISNYTVSENVITTESGSLTLDLQRLSPMSQVTIETITHGDMAFGLLRYDNQWLFEPLTIQMKKKIHHNSETALKAPKESGKRKKVKDPVKILAERASRLLRK